MFGHHHHHHRRPEEGKMTKAIEKQTSRVPSVVYLSAAAGAMAASLALHCLKHKKTSLFIGQWAAPILIMGLYNKIVKTEGHDRKWRV